MQLPQKKPQLVIFDCDGVLVDSEPIFIRTLQKYLGVGAAGLGVEELQAICVGKTRADVEELLCRLGVAFPPTWPGDFYERLFRAFKDAHSGELGHSFRQHSATWSEVFGHL